MRSALPQPPSSTAVPPVVAASAGNTMIAAAGFAPAPQSVVGPAGFMPSPHMALAQLSPNGGGAFGSPNNNKETMQQAQQLMFANAMNNPMMHWEAMARSGAQPGQLMMRPMLASTVFHHSMMAPTYAVMGGSIPAMQMMGNVNTPLNEYRPLEQTIAPASMARSGSSGYRPSSTKGEQPQGYYMMYDPNSNITSPHYVENRSVKRSKRSDAHEGDDDHESASTGSGSGYQRRPKKDKLHAPGQGGKRRLKINFISLGVAGEDPQLCGKSGSIIPDGLRGRHEMHNQPWEFHITHDKTEGVTVVKWSVTNLTSGKTVSVTETPFQAKVRQKTGNTITSFVMRQALEQRVRDLEEQLNKPDYRDNPVQVANIESLIKDLRRKERNEGILFFGLRHEDVQEQHNRTASTEEGDKS